MHSKILDLISCPLMKNMYGRSSSASSSSSSPFKSAFCWRNATSRVFSLSEDTFLGMEKAANGVSPKNKDLV